MKRMVEKLMKRLMQQQNLTRQIRIGEMTKISTKLISLIDSLYDLPFRGWTWLLATCQSVQRLMWLKTFHGKNSKETGMKCSDPNLILRSKVNAAKCKFNAEAKISWWLIQSKRWKMVSSSHDHAFLGT